MAERAPKSFDLGEYVKALLRRKWLFIVPALVGIVAGFIISNVLPPIYESRSVLVMRAEERLAEPLAKLVGRSSAAGQLSRLQEKVKSTSFLIELARTLEITKDPDIVAWAEGMHSRNPALPVEEYAERKAVDYLETRIVVNRTSETVFEVIARDTDPDRAFALAQHITNTFLTSSMREQIEEIRAVHDFSVEQIVLYKQKLDDAEARLRAYQERRVASTPVANPVNAENVNRVDVLISQASVDATRADERLNERRNELRSAAGPDYDRLAGLTSETLTQSGQQLVNLESQVASALVRQPTGGPEVNSLLVTTAERKGELREQARALASRAVPSAPAKALDAYAELKLAEIEVSMVTERRSVLDRFMWGYTRGRTTATEDELELTRLRQEVESNRALYDAFVEQSAAGQITEALEAAHTGGRFEVIESPVRPVTPVAPDKIMIVFLSLVGGAVVGLGAVLAQEQRDTSFKDIDEIEDALKLPVLATVPDADVFHAVTDREKTLRRQGKSRPTNGDSPLLRYLVRETPVSFEFRRMARKLARRFRGDIPKAMLITSAHRGEGKSTAAACLAITLAKHYGKRTILVDCDLRKPKAHLLLEVAASPGISDALERGHLLGTDVKPTALPTLFVLPCGSKRDRATWLLESLPGSRVMEELLARYDHVIIDSAPNIAVPDALLLGGAVDGVVMVVKAGSTPREVSLRGVALQQEDKPNILGLVVNNLEHVLPYYYDYKYYGYSRSGSEGEETGRGGGNGAAGEIPGEKSA